MWLGWTTPIRRWTTGHLPPSTGRRGYAIWTFRCWLAFTIRAATAKAIVGSSRRGRLLAPSSKTRTTRITTDPAGNVSFDYSQQPPFKRTALGVTAGFGGQFIDPVGLRVIPEVRYTRWLGLNFDVPGNYSRRDQIEFVLSLAF